MVTPSTPGGTPVATDLVPCALQDVPAADLVVERVETSGRRPLGRLVQLALKLSGLVMGVVSHQAFTDLSLRYKRVTWQGSFPRAGLCCPRPSSGTATPSATLPARRDFPFQRLYAPPAPGPQAPGAGEGFPSSRVHPLAIPLPLPRRVPQRLHVQVLSAFHGLRREFSGSAPSCPFTGLASRGCRIRLMLRAGQSLPQRGFRRCASTLGVSPQRRQPATGPPGTGLRVGLFLPPPPLPTGAPRCWAHESIV